MVAPLTYEKYTSLENLFFVSHMVFFPCNLHPYLDFDFDFYSHLYMDVDRISCHSVIGILVYTCMLCIHVYMYFSVYMYVLLRGMNIVSFREMSVL